MRDLPKLANLFLNNRTIVIYCFRLFKIPLVYINHLTPLQTGIYISVSKSNYLTISVNDSINTKWYDASRHSMSNVYVKNDRKFGAVDNL